MAKRRGLSDEERQWLIDYAKAKGYEPGKKLKKGIWTNELEAQFKEKFDRSMSKDSLAWYARKLIRVPKVEKKETEAAS